MVVKISFKIKKEELKLDVKELNTLIQQVIGLMFRKSSPPLLFLQKKPIIFSIHSFFCRPFVAIWFLDNKIIDIKTVRPNQFSVKPRDKFDKLLEVPDNNKEYKRLNYILSTMAETFKY